MTASTLRRLQQCIVRVRRASLTDIRLLAQIFPVPAVCANPPVYFMLQAENALDTALESLMKREMLESVADDSG